MDITPKQRASLVARLSRMGREVAWRWDGPPPKDNPLEGLWICTEWQGSVTESGYPTTGCPFMTSANGKRTTVRVHRLAWMLAHGPIPEGLVIHHLCNNRRCFNLRHLKLVSQSENIKEMMKVRKQRKGKSKPRLRFIIFREEKRKKWKLRRIMRFERKLPRARISRQISGQGC